MNTLSALRLRLREVGNTRGLAAELARQAGVDPSTVSEWVSGKYLPGLDKLDAIAAVLGLTVPELFLHPDHDVPLIGSTKGTSHASSASRQEAKLPPREVVRLVAQFVFAQTDHGTRSEILASFLPAPDDAQAYPSSRRTAVRSHSQTSSRSRRRKTA